MYFLSVQYLCPINANYSVAFQCLYITIFFGSLWFIWGWCERQTLNTKHVFWLHCPYRLPYKHGGATRRPPVSKTLAIRMCKRSLLWIVKTKQLLFYSNYTFIQIYFWVLYRAFQAKKSKPKCTNYTFIDLFSRKVINGEQYITVYIFMIYLWYMLKGH